MIRKYEDEDWESICILHDLARPAELKGSVPLEAFIPLKDAADNEGLFDGEVFVGELKRNVVGFVAWEPHYITWLYVHPDHQRKGYGRQLLQFALSQLSGIVEVSMLEGNHGALALYESEGFVMKEKKTGKLQGNEAFTATGYILEKEV